jgi:hypothetical protein
MRRSTSVTNPAFVTPAVLTVSLTLAFVASMVTVGSASAGTDAAPTTGNRPPLSLSLSATLAPAPAQVTARIRVEPDARSRSLSVEWWSEDGVGGSHAVTLDGDRAMARQDVAMKRIEPGRYVVRAILTREDGTTVTKQSNLVVVGEESVFSTTASNGTDLGALPPPARRRR